MDKGFWKDFLKAYVFAFLAVGAIFGGVFVLGAIVVGIGWLLNQAGV